MQYLTDPTMTISELAKVWQLPQYRIASLLKGKDFEDFKRVFQESIADMARDKLLSASELAADEWIKTLPIARSKGDHRPMKDLLAANRVIELSPSAQSPVVIQIGINTDHLSVSLPLSAPGITSIPASQGLIPALPTPPTDPE